MPHFMSKLTEQIARTVTRWCGDTWALVLSVLTIVVWLVAGPFCEWSDTWQLSINTGTTIITFIMVFILQRSQNKDAKVIQLKLDELLAHVKGSDHDLIGAEELSEEAIERLRLRHRKMKHGGVD